MRGERKELVKGGKAMKRSPILLLCALLALALAPSAAATTTKLPVASHDVFVSETQTGEEGLTGTVMWVRDKVWLFASTGDPLLAGEQTIGINYDLDISTGSGEIWGKYRIDPTAYPTGHFDCSWTATFVDYLWTGRAVCHGDDSLSGRQLRLQIIAEPGGTVTNSIGFTFVPGDPS